MTKQNEKQQGQKRNPRPLHQTAYASALDSIAKLSSSWLASFTYDNACLHTHTYTHKTHTAVSTIRQQQQQQFCPPFNPMPTILNSTSFALIVC